MNSIVYLIVPKESGKAVWRNYGTAYICKDGSFNIKFDLFPDLTFNCRLPTSGLEASHATHGTLDKKVPEEVT